MTDNTAVAEVYSFPTEFVENLHVLENASLLLSTMKSHTGLLYILDPKVPGAQAKVVTTFDSNVTALTGIAPLPCRDNDLPDTKFKEPTSVALARDSKSIYISTGGNFRASPREGGQVIQVALQQ